MISDSMIIAVDFDGTIVEHEYPKIGREVSFAIQTLKMFQEKGFRLILWTCRHGKELEAAVQFCRGKGLEFYAVNKNYPEENSREYIHRKIVADVYIDDCNYGVLPPWSEIYRSICEMDY